MMAARSPGDRSLMLSLGDRSFMADSPSLGDRSFMADSSRFPGLEEFRWVCLGGDGCDVCVATVW